MSQDEYKSESDEESVESDQSSPQVDDSPADSDQPTDQSEQQPVEDNQAGDQPEQQVTDEQPAEQPEEQAAESHEPAEQAEGQLTQTEDAADTRLAFAKDDASPATGGGGGTTGTLKIRIRIDDRVLNEPGKTKVILPTELQNLLVQQVATSFKPLQGDSVSVSVEWGKFTDAELETPGNIEVVLTPGWGDTFTPALEVAKRHKVISTAGAERFAGEARNAGGVHFQESDVPRDILLGPIVVTVPHIFRDRVIQWSRRDATGYDKAPAEMTITYLGKGVSHEVGHNLGLSDILNDIDPDSADKNDKWPSERPNIMDILPLPNAKPYEETMDWDEGPKSEVESRRQEAIDAIRGPVVLPKKYVDHFPDTLQRLRAFSWKDPEPGSEGTVQWWPRYEKFEFTNEQIDNMRSFRSSVH